MAIWHTIDEAARRLTIHVSGVDHCANAEETISLVFSDRRITRPFSVLIVVDVSAETPSQADMVHIAAVLDRLRTLVGGRIAIVAPNVAHTSAARLIALLGSTPRLGSYEEVAYFADEASARAWLNDPAG